MFNQLIELQREDFGEYWLAWASPVEQLPLPGQFYMFFGEYVKKPFSAAFVELDTVYFIIRKVGPFTRNLPPTVRLEGPYGNGFPMDLDKVTLISGGAGMAPIAFLAQQLQKKGKEFKWYHGESREDNLAVIQALPVKPHRVTVDPVLVTDVLKPNGAFCACGPRPMLKATVEKLGTHGFVSMEERMACGFGACNGCVIPTVSGYKKVCKDGPVFEAGDIAWHLL
ncbi:dihydroorotate dehydrogenase [Coprothermobacteraceae bacterium]|nr:dihydroorotate dehydrogenase [Coprothermobacteraceae bacterium]